MLNIKTRGEVRHINVRAEMHGDEIEPAFDVRLMLLSVPVDKISTLCPKLGDVFYVGGDQVQLGEVNPLTVHHKVENVQATIGDYSSTGCDVAKGAKINLLPGKVCNLDLKLQFQSGNVNAIIEYLRDEVDVTISERQMTLADTA